jgi:hypothetical protein
MGRSIDSALLAQCQNPSRSAFPEAGLYLQQQEELVVALSTDHFLDTCVSLAMTLDAPENQSFVLLLLDVFSYLLQPYWAASPGDLLRVKALSVDAASRGHKSVRPADVPRQQDPLAACLLKEKLTKRDHAVVTARHSRFGAQFAVLGSGKYVHITRSATDLPVTRVHLLCLQRCPVTAVSQRVCASNGPITAAA